MIQTITGTVKQADGTDWSGAVVEFQLDTGTGLFTRAGVAGKTDGSGDFSVEVSNNATVTKRCLVRLPDDNIFAFDLDPNDATPAIGTIQTSNGDAEEPRLTETNAAAAGGSAAWGGITGTLSAQTDLQTELDAKADLVAGKVPAGQLPAYVDDVVEAANFAALPVSGETGKIYVTLDDNKTYRWSGSAYVEISASLALGETSGTAYRGDRGKTAYDHSQLTSGNPHSVTKGDVGLGNVSNLDPAGQVAAGGGMIPRYAEFATLFADLPACTYDNGASGVGATLTADANGELLINGISGLGGLRVLVGIDEGDPESGLYEVTSAGSVGTPWVLTRVADFCVSAQIIQGSVVSVSNDPTALQEIYFLESPSNPVVGTDSIWFNTRPKDIGYKIYRALLTQTSTNAPTATVLENSLGGTVVWSYADIGKYNATLSNAFTANKTHTAITLSYDLENMQPTFQVISARRISADAVRVETGRVSEGTLGEMALADGLMSDVSITILVYP